MDMTGKNCLVNGHLWSDCPEGSEEIQEYEPVSLPLQNELLAVQAELDQLITMNAGLKVKMPSLYRQHFDSECLDFEKYFESLSKSRNLNDQDSAAVVDDCMIDIVDDSVLEKSVELLDDLVKMLPPLVAKSERYLTFVEGELGNDDRFNKHLSSNNQQTAGDRQTGSFGLMLSQKVQRSYEKAVSNRPLNY